ncbi:MAG: single-stranded DNA-binding protein [Bryobacteraceae bacterium]
MIKNSSSFDALRSHIAALSSPSLIQKDSDGFYQLTTDASGNGGALIRFLPSKGSDGVPVVKLCNHAFKSEYGKWFIENCPGTINLACPVCDSNRELFSTRNEEDKKLALARKAKTYHVSNILVVKDPKAPQNEGKVFLYKYGVRVLDKIKDVLQPQFEDLLPIDPFDPYEGANFRLRVTKTGAFPDYDKSVFEQPSPLGDEEMVNGILSRCRPLQSVVEPKNFKAYDELKAKFEKIIGAESATNAYRA